MLEGVVTLFRAVFLRRLAVDVRKARLFSDRFCND